jgi:hypothetical protein
MSDPNYDSLLGHIKHHNLRRWLLNGARDEDANTIRMAIEKLSDRQLNRRFARLLAKGEK